jgi:hypothetical protein
VNTTVSNTRVVYVILKRSWRANLNYTGLVNALKETVRQLQGADPTEPAIKELEKAVVLALAKLDDGESTPMAAD